MRVRLLTTFEQLDAMEHNAAYAMLTCHANTDKLEHEPARNFIEKALKMHHDSILEHITLTYEVNNLSRACLQELARHRHISLSVESTRHTLRKKVEDGVRIELLPYTLLSKLQIMLSSFTKVAEDNFQETTNDELKYYIPEFWPTNLVMTANIRELRHIVKLRTAPAALAEFQELAHKFVDSLPNRFMYLFKDCVYKE